MPITITLQAFQAGTSHPLWDRLASKLWHVDWYLREYFQILDQNPDDLDLTMVLEDILKSIADWAQGKRTRVVDGETRYRDWRDRKGLISRLEREARGTLQEVRIVAHNIASNLVGRRLTMRASAPRSQSLRTSVPQALGLPLSEPTDWPGLSPNTPLRRGSIAAAARLLALSRLQVDVRGQKKLPDAADLAEAIGRATGIAVPVLQTSVLIEQIAQGLDQLGYGVDHVRRTDLAGLNAALACASPTNPVLLCVGDRTPDHAWNGPGGRAHGPAAQTVHAVVCTGRNRTGDGFNVEDFHFGSKRCVLFDDGDYFARDLLGTEALMNAEPSLGHIRVRRLGA